MKWGILLIQVLIAAWLFGELGPEPTAVNLMFAGWSVFAIVLTHLPNIFGRGA